MVGILTILSEEETSVRLRMDQINEHNAKKVNI